MRYLLILSLIFLYQVCSHSMAANYTQSAYYWRGKSVSSLLRQWGTPDMQYPGPRGQTIYVYKTETYKTYTHPPTGAWVHVSGTGRPVVGTTYNPTNENRNLTLICTTIFTVNAQGIITQVQLRGTCYDKR